MKGMIAEDIKNAHDRVAVDYGLAKVGKPMAKNSYDAWNYQSNLVRPLTRIANTHWLDRHVVDAGCGNGQISEILLKNGVRTVAGIDFSQKMLETAVRRFQDTEMQNRFIPLRADIESLQMIKPCTFDGAVLFGVLEHLDSPEKVLESLLATLKTGAVLAVSVPRTGSLTHLSFLLFGDSPKRWGVKKQITDWFRFSEKANYYRFFSISRIQAIISGLPNVTVIERIPFAFGHLDGLPGLPLRLLGKSSSAGHLFLNGLDNICRLTGFIPAGEFWLIKKLD